MKTLKELEFEYGESSYGNTLEHYVYNYLQSEMKQSLAASERIRMSDAQSAIREANSLRGSIQELEILLQKKLKDQDDFINEVERLNKENSYLEKEVETLREKISNLEV